ncbi:MAG: hypothetical protein AVDCRST_MAG17-1557 [uncultured Solirubrobacterales bacterium]|uniref:Gram-positive cocci surface proteins LPxTG domain-containing protein n=1 Tax=uncultured Solirubrobacterales bacterium TaxID=768556 RepID=A0A6J4SSI1_9ACTN|nr:MAG: hypothetical protein AVDCRST_MAG17-1557 [uncultured Solirubrobacterales bacterium]
MTKVIGMLVALAIFCAMPAVAFAGGGDNDNVSSGNTQNGEIDQGAAGGDGGDGGSGSDGDDDGDGDGGDGGDAGNQAAICQQNAGDDANCSIDQSQNFGGDTFVDGDGDGEDDSEDNDVEGDDDNDGEGGGDFEDDDDVTSGGTGGGVDSVELAQTGFDAWVLALIGGFSLVGGLGLLAVQRRGRLNA